jgi:hypothetical protein
VAGDQSHQNQNRGGAEKQTARYQANGELFYKKTKQKLNGNRGQRSQRDV